MRFLIGNWKCLLLLLINLIYLISIVIHQQVVVEGAKTIDIFEDEPSFQQHYQRVKRGANVELSRHALTERVRREGINANLEKIAHAIPKDLVETVKNAKEDIRTKNFRLRATCIYINWLRVTINQWKDHRTEATELIAQQFKEYTHQTRSIGKDLIINNKNGAMLLSKVPNLPVSPVKFDQYMKETVFNINAAIDSLITSDLEEVVEINLSKTALKERKRRILENAYFRLLREMLFPNCKGEYNIRKNKILEKAYEKIADLQNLKSLIDEDKNQFANALNEYNNLKAVGMPSTNLVPVNRFKLEVLDKRVDYVALPPDAQNPYEQLREQKCNNRAQLEMAAADRRIQQEKLSPPKQNQEEVKGKRKALEGSIDHRKKHDRRLLPTNRRLLPTAAADDANSNDTDGEHIEVNEHINKIAAQLFNEDDNENEDQQHQQQQQQPDDDRRQMLVQAWESLLNPPAAGGGSSPSPSSSSSAIASEQQQQKQQQQKQPHIISSILTI